MLPKHDNAVQVAGYSHLTKPSKKSLSKSLVIPMGEGYGRALREIPVICINNALSIVRRILNLAARKWRDEYGLTWLETPPLLSMHAQALSAVMGRAKRAVSGVARASGGNGIVQGQHGNTRTEGLPPEVELGNRSTGAGRQRISDPGGFWWSN